MQLPPSGLDRYTSASQRARVCTEPWGEENLYCPVCDSPRIASLAANTPAHDFSCPKCKSWFQLKSKSSPFGTRVQDGAYEAMKKSMRSDRTPNLFLLHYKLPELHVRNVLLIPHFVFTESILEKRKPLSATARRAGWVGCNFLLDRIPSDARISVVENGQPFPASSVRRAYNRLRPLEKLHAEKRGWTLDVLNIVRSLKRAEFALADVYEYADELAKLHPKNAHVRDKIRQQLQELRKLDVLEFHGGGRYRLR